MRIEKVMPQGWHGGTPDPRHDPIRKPPGRGGKISNEAFPDRVLFTVDGEVAIAGELPLIRLAQVVFANAGVKQVNPIRYFHRLQDQFREFLVPLLALRREAGSPAAHRRLLLKKQRPLRDFG